MLIKALGLALAVASGLSLGKEVIIYFLYLGSYRIMTHKSLGPSSTRSLLHGVSFVSRFQATTERRRVGFLISAVNNIYLPRLCTAQKRKLLAAAAAAGVSVAFGSPLGGVLFGLEELDTFAFSNESDVMWRGFVTSVIAAVSLQYIDPFGTSKLVLFQVTSISDTWRAFELVRTSSGSLPVEVTHTSQSFIRCRGFYWLLSE